MSGLGRVQTVKPLPFAELLIEVVFWKLEQVAEEEVTWRSGRKGVLLRSPRQASKPLDEDISDGSNRKSDCAKLERRFA